MFLYLYRKYKKSSVNSPKSPEKARLKWPHIAATTQPADASTAFTTTTDDSRPKRCETCVAEKSAARRYRWKLMFFLLPGFFLSSLDLTIVATALPFMASHFNKLNQLNWIVTALTLTETAFMPMFGQLADTFGRHPALQLAVIVMTIGSVLCAAAPVWSVLLLGRALQGVGVAGLQNVSMIVLADSVSLKEQATNTSIFQLMSGIGYSVGPVIGGYITSSNWRYAFVLCAGIGVVSVFTTFLLRHDLKQGRVSITHPTRGQSHIQTLTWGLSSLDFGGTTLFIAGVALIILGTAWGGSTFRWNSAAVIVSLVLGVFLLLCFVLWEYLLESDRLLSRRFPCTVPLIPFSILRNKDVGLICSIAAATGAALYSVFYFIGIYFTLAEAYPASEAGVQLLYYVPGLGVGVYLAIFLCTFSPRQTFPPLVLGTMVETAGIAALTYAVSSRNATLVNVMMGISGAGTGLRFMPSSLHLAGMFRSQLAAAYSLLRFALPFGGTLALTVMGSVFQNEMADILGNNANGSSSGSFNLHNQAALQAIAQLPEAEQRVVRERGAQATMWAFISIMPVLGLSLVASLGLGNVWIGGRGKGDVEEDAAAIIGVKAAEATAASTGEKAATVKAGAQDRGANAERNEVLESVYLLAMLRGRVKSERRRPPGPVEVDTGGRSREREHEMRAI